MKVTQINLDDEEMPVSASCLLTLDELAVLFGTPVTLPRWMSPVAGASVGLRQVSTLRTVSDRSLTTSTGMASMT